MGSEACKILKYWNEIAHTKHQFFKVMCADFQHRMMIPLEFCECFKGKLGEWCTLKGPSGDTWMVRVIQPQQDSAQKIFSDGWAKFVQDNRIKEYDFLVFSSFSFDSAYNVFIFDRTGCESVAACFSTNKSNPNTGHQEDSEPMSNENESLPLDIHQQHPFFFSSSSSSSSSEDSSPRPINFRVPRRRVRKVGRPCSTSTSGAKQVKTVYESRRRPVSEKEIRSAQDKAAKYELENQCRENMFRIQMLPSHVYHDFHLTIPKDWASKNMITKNHQVKLRVPEVGKWEVSCRWTLQLQCQLRPRWPLFVMENNLEEHDVCVFELVKKGVSKKIVPEFNVYIFRVVDEIVELKKIRM